MSSYSDRIDDKRRRFEDLAGKAKDEAEQIRGARRREAELIPFGQPVLVGHHSERKHRKAIARANSQHDKEAELYQKASYYERKARAVGTGGISSDDPEAIQTLEAQAQELEATREHYKSVNKRVSAAVRKAKKACEEDTTPDYFSIVVELNLDENDSKSLLGVVRMFQGYRAPKYDLANIGANIRRIRARIATMREAEECEELPKTEREGYTVEYCKERNRVRFMFERRPSKQVCSLMKANGYRWSPTEGTWQRQLTANGIASARRVIEALDEGREAGSQESLASR